MITLELGIDYWICLCGCGRHAFQLNQYARGHAPTVMARPCRSCVNPDHLFLGDHQANVDDQVSKGRHTAGMRHWKARLTPEQVAEIRRRYVPSSGAGRPDGNKDDLAREFGVHPKYVYSIWKGHYRRDVPAAGEAEQRGSAE